jgi:predicted anti-sigma-YlaC factor YlaD
MRAPDLTCQQLVEIVTEYLEGTLPAEDHARFESHLAGCQGCRYYVNQMRQTVQLLGHLSEETILPDTHTELLALFRNWKQTDLPR